jgi:hypothetical protein
MKTGHARVIRNAFHVPERHIHFAKLTTSRAMPGAADAQELFLRRLAHRLFLRHDPPSVFRWLVSVAIAKEKNSSANCARPS